MSVAGLCYRQVPLNEVSFDLRWNLHPWSADPSSSDLCTSFARDGIHHPPFLLQRGDHFYEILAGHRRCRHAYVSQCQEIWAGIIPAATDSSVLLDVLLCDQLLSRPLSLVEIARFHEICSRFLPPEMFASRYLGRLQLSKSRVSPDDLNRLLRLDHEILTAIDEGIIQEKMAIELLRLDDSIDQITLVRLFRQLQLGDNQQRKIYTALRDLCRRMQLSITAYLNSPEVAAVLTSQHLNPPQKVQHLGRLLQEQLSPEATEAEKVFTTRVKELRLPPQVTLQHCQAFETDAIHLTIKFPSLSACSTVLPEITKLLNKTS